MPAQTGMTFLRDAIVPAMNRLERPVTPEELHAAAALGKSADHLGVAMRSLTREGILREVGQGRYATLAWFLDEREREAERTKRREAERRAQAERESARRAREAAEAKRRAAAEAARAADRALKCAVLERLEPIVAPDIAEVLASIREDLSKL